MTSDDYPTGNVTGAYALAVIVRHDVAVNTSESLTPVIVGTVLFVFTGVIMST